MAEEKFISYETLFEETIGISPMNERVDFSYFPRFGDDPKLKDLMRVTKEAEGILEREGASSNVSGEKIGTVLLNFCDIYFNVCDLIAVIPSTFSIIGIPFYLLDRLIEKCIKEGKEELAKTRANKAIATLKRAKDKVKDKEAKKRIQSTIDKMENRLKDIDEP